MNSLELRVVLRLALQVHLLEHVESRLLALLARTGTSLLLNGSSELPARLSTLESECLAVVTGCDDLILAAPQEALEGKQLSSDGHNSTWGLVRRRGVHNGDTAVVGGEGETVAAGREGDGVNPASRVVEELSADGVERDPLTPRSRLGTGVDALDEAGEDTGVCIGRASSKQDGIGVPRNACNGAADGLLQVL